MFHAEVNRALMAAAALINTAAGPRSGKPTPDTLDTTVGLEAFLQEQDPQLDWTDAPLGSKQLENVRDLRAKLRRIWELAPITETNELELINELLQGVGSRLVHQGAPGASAVTQVPIPVSEQIHHLMSATIGAGLSHLVVEAETGRLRICRGNDCEAALVDLTRNRSKLFCDFGNCANRAHVRAYRARQAAQKRPGRSAGTQ